MRNLPASDMIESCSIAGPGFVNVKLSKQWIAKVNLSFHNCIPFFNLLLILVTYFYGFTPAEHSKDAERWY